MENRFGIKDFFLFLLLAGLIAVVIVAMFQFDRQYEQILAIKQQNSELTRDIVSIKRQLAQGVVGLAPGAGPGAAPEALEVFEPLVAAEEKPDFARGDWLVDNFGTKVGKLTPLVSTDVYQAWVEARVMEPLATRDIQTLEWIPVLAESWEVTDNSKQWNEYVQPWRDQGMTPDQISQRIKGDEKAPVALEITFRLRRGVSFSDGAPFTADDVVFTFDLARHPDVNAPRVRAYLEKLRSVEAKGSHEVVFKFNEPYFLNFETAASSSILSKAFYSRFKPQEINDRTGLLIGTGAYKLEDPENWSPGKPVELVRNDRYWGLPGTFNRLIWREIEDESAEMVMFGNGELDILGCTPEQYEKLLKDERILKMSQNMKYSSPLNGYSYIGWNQRRGSGADATKTAFADERVRQAMTLLIDRERIAREVFLGYATVASGPFSPGGPQAAPDLKPLPYDEQLAKSLLKQAGYADTNGDGVIDGPNGRPFRFKLSYPSGSATYQRVVLFLKDSFARAGITMEPDPLDFPVLLDKIKRGDFDACTLGWGGVIESDPYQIFHSSQIKDQGDNRTHYVNRELDALIETARMTIDDEARMKLWHDVHRILHKDQPYTFLFNSPSLVFINGRIQNVEPSKVGLNYVRLYPNPIPWFVPEAQQKYTQ